ncbi:hypothetical protein CHS0354_000855 [Potamilus streckersoni]|uniref:Carboxylic ester hydrolase n=1 Tax=Potamilus streckersoni TaxID=2493646 RepID=A0AAE0RUU7_9BIVA|nr:hypothetical protein CHS0354_000855 [Potamilus streckersoni]
MNALLILSWTLVMHFATALETIIVHSKVGTIAGFRDNVTFNGESRGIVKFLGIPYAEAPIGDRRFSKPVSKAPFKSTYHALNTGVSCPANVNFFPTPGLTYDENCLNLDIYVPSPAFQSENTNVTYPVMIWIYGGGFIIGTKTYYDAGIISSFHDVIVVTINYRLSVFGFLSTGDSASPGNYGLWDQQLAIKWAHGNIGAFGGDNTKITLFGQSAGSASVFYQALYPGNKGLFHRIIGESGTPLSLWAFAEKSEIHTKVQTRFLTNLNCMHAESSVIINCLRSKSVPEIIKALNITTGIHTDLNITFDKAIDLRFNFGPMLDREFLQISPDKIFGARDPKAQDPMSMFSSVDVMTGVNSMDSSIYVGFQFDAVINYYANHSIAKGCPKSVFDTVIVPAITRNLLYLDVPAIDNAIIHEYTDWIDPDDDIRVRDKLVELATDFTFLVPAIKTLLVHTEHAQDKGTFLYKYSHKPTFKEGIDNDYLTRASHAEELAFVFGFAPILSPIGSKNATHEEITLSRIMMTMWTNFAKSGDPNKPVDISSFANVTWPRFDVRDQKYIDFDVNMSEHSVKSRWSPDKVSFWQKVVPSIIQAATQHGPGLNAIPIVGRK